MKQLIKTLVEAGLYEEAQQVLTEVSAVSAPRLRKVAGGYELQVALRGAPEDPDTVERLGMQLSKLLRGSGVRVEMSIDDVGGDDATEPYLSILVK